MTKRSIISFLLLLICTLSHFVRAQDVTALMMQAQLLEKSFKDDEALAKYLEVLRTDPRNIDALCKVSELHTIIGKRFNSNERQRNYYKKAVEYAEAALGVNSNYAEANFVMAISKGRIALISSGDEKIKAVREIKQYADRSVQLDPNNFKGYHVLAKWHYEVSDLSALERWIVKVTYGALPDASLANAIKYYEKSKQLNPGFLLNYLELAKAFKRNNDKNKARELLRQLQNLPQLTSDDAKIKSLGRKMLDEL